MSACAIASTLYPSRRAAVYSTPRFIREQNEQIENFFSPPATTHVSAISSSGACARWSRETWAQC